MARNELQELHNGELHNIQSIRVCPYFNFNVNATGILMQILNANHNAIHDSGLPPDVFSIRDLVTLDLSHNNLTRVPEELPNARNIIVLSFSHNSITSVPGTVSGWLCLCLPYHRYCVNY